MFDVAYTGIDGSVWNLDGRGAGLQGAFTKTIEGLVGEAKTETTPAPGRVGARTTGLPLIEPFTGTLTVVLSARVAPHLRELADILRAFRRAWSTLADGELTVQSAYGLRLRTRARLASPLPFPGGSPFDPRQPWLELPVEVECRDGVWLGPPDVVDGGLVVNSGELTAWPVVTWTGTGTVTAPGADPLTLPPTAVEAALDCDPATSSQITVAGEPAPELWSQLRGRTFPIGVPADGQAQWEFSPGLSVTVTPRLLDPWRW